MNKKIIIIITAIIIILALLITILFLFNKPSSNIFSPKTCDLECDKYRHDNCPKGCVTNCIPSSCAFDQGSNMEVCTDDCGGLGSCSCSVNK